MIVELNVIILFSDIVEQNNPMFKCGLSATSLEIFSEKPDDLACL